MYAFPKLHRQLSYSTSSYIINPLNPLVVFFVVVIFYLKSLKLEGKNVQTIKNLEKAD